MSLASAEDGETVIVVSPPSNSFLTSRNRVYPEVLETATSESFRRLIFSSRWNWLIPDFFYVLCYITIFSASAVMDRFMIIVFMINKQYTFTWLYLTAIVLGYFAINTNQRTRRAFRKERGLPPPDIIHKSEITKIFCIVLGAGPLFLVIEMLWDAMVREKYNHVRQDNDEPIQIFHTSNIILSTLKSSALITAGVKGILQIFICIMLFQDPTVHHLQMYGCYVILLNILMISWALTGSLPLKAKPLILHSFIWILLHNFLKFSACISLIACKTVFFVIMVKMIGKYTIWVILGHFVLYYYILIRNNYYTPSVTWSVRDLGYKPVLALFYIFMYIHPKENTGNLLYFIFYLTQFLIEIFIIYVSNVEEYYTFYLRFLLLYVCGIAFLALQQGVYSYADISERIKLRRTVKTINR